ncbi:E3 ubiquitin-protein ligase TRIM39-like [Clinocottus analis]|uniref:E3 ubiquitin-protein ligase TRIM39-like n=1 Tax=Clinocottus analis TaxID=304258 RepID=UPI0035C17DEE
MASGSSLLSEEQLLCPICLDVFKRPVSTPCGHNFCMSCISTYWNGIPATQCPVCKESFVRRPDLKVNTFISELTSQFMTLQPADPHIWSPDQQQALGGGAVLCDICTDTQREAVRSCLECLTSYCDVHLEPHHRAAGLKRHTLVEPIVSLEDKICKDHTRLLTMLCRNDGALVCDVCVRLSHVSHDVVSVKRFYEERMALLGNTEAKVQQMIQERLQKVLEVIMSVEQSKAETKDVIADSARDLATLVSEIQKSRTELVKAIEEKQKASEEEAAGLISDMRREITELQETTMKLKELKQTGDLPFLHSSPNPSILSHTMDLSSISLNGQAEIRRMQKALSDSVSHLRMLVNKMSSDTQKVIDGTDASNKATLRFMQQYEVDVELDPDTAHPRLVLSDDGKQVRFGTSSGLKKNMNPNPKMFTANLAVLGKRGFSSHKFYFEVFVGGKTEWSLGVATASLQRKGAFGRSPPHGLWVVQFVKDKFEAPVSANQPVRFGKVERVGVFVDYDGGQISFYDAQTATPIYSFPQCVFTEELHPYLNPCDNEYGSNSGPMTIVPVQRKE